MLELFDLPRRKKMRRFCKNLNCADRFTCNKFTIEENPKGTEIISKSYHKCNFYRISSDAKRNNLWADFG